MTNWFSSDLDYVIIEAVFRSTNAHPHRRDWVGGCDVDLRQNAPTLWTRRVAADCTTYEPSAVYWFAVYGLL